MDLSNTWEEFIDTPLANLADQITALSGDDVSPLDDIQNLLIALRRAGMLNKYDMMQVQALYLSRKPETWQQMAERLGVEVNRDSSFVEMEFKKGRCLAYILDRAAWGPNDSFDATEARDLSDCLQVAARYLEEVEQ